MTIFRSLRAFNLQKICSCRRIVRNNFSSQRIYNTVAKDVLQHNSQFGLPKTAIAISQKRVGYWLLGCSGMITFTVVLGGLTRLTESGLSMVTWKLLGEKWPSKESDWEAEFEMYKQFPEYKILNRDMTLQEFKFIYVMEYVHRMLGRTVGCVFLLPAAYFWFRGNLTAKLKPRVLLGAILLGAQGLMGWYMVKSGLEDKFQDVNDVPRVSQYRLASHLTLAFTLYTLCLSTGLSCLLPVSHAPTKFAKIAALRRLAYSAKGLVFFTAISGAFVAGLDAGLVYNSFPKMGDYWVPPESFQLSPVFKNFTENPVTVQLDHRVLGITTLSLISATYILGRKANLPKRAQWALTSVALMACAQVTMGISTLLYHVPTQLAAAHQTGSLALLSLIIWFTQEIKFLKYIPK